jgi:hypothetical protein
MRWAVSLGLFLQHGQAGDVPIRNGNSPGHESGRASIEGLKQRHCTGFPLSAVAFSKYLLFRRRTKASGAAAGSCR